jgi:hypothetical protein
MTDNAKTPCDGTAKPFADLVRDRPGFFDAQDCRPGPSQLGEEPVERRLAEVPKAKPGKKTR